MPTLDLPAGPLDYVDTGGSGPVIVFGHGLMMDSTIWDAVVRALGPGVRCVLPTLPLGAQRHAMHPDADLSMTGIANLLGQFIERLDLRDVTLVANDWGGPLITATRYYERVGRLVVTSCEAFRNVPPGLAGKVILLSSWLPGGLWLSLKLLQFRWFRRLPFTFGWMSRKPIAHEVMDRWFGPGGTRADVRRDLAKYVRPALRERGVLEDATERLRAFEKPALIVWATEDRLMPIAHGRALAAMMRDARLVEVADSYTLVPHDQPERLASAMREFVAHAPHARIAEAA